VNLEAEDLHHLDDSEGVQDRGKILFTASMGFFTDGYDLFIIGLVLVILKTQWGISGGIEKLGASSVALLTAAFGSWAFGRLADRFGRKSVYGWEMLALAAGAIASAFSPNIWWLIAFRAILGFGIGGDYPVSSTIMSEYAARKDRGKMVALVFSASGHRAGGRTVASGCTARRGRGSRSDLADPARTRRTTRPVGVLASPPDRRNAAIPPRAADRRPSCRALKAVRRPTAGLTGAEREIGPIGRSPGAAGIALTAARS
jgi:hypothetical protein